MVKVKDYEISLMQMMQRMAQNDTNTSRFTAVNLVPVLYSQVSPPNQAELLEIFQKISSDAFAPMRKQAIIVFNNMIQLMPRVPDSELLAMFTKIVQDEQDSVRMHAVECCVTFS